MPNEIMNQFPIVSSVVSLPAFVLNLGLTALLSFLLGLAYVRFGHALSNRRVFARNFLLLSVTTMLVITIVKSSLALSLGLVGALSIVRFRSAIKEPEELAFLFLAISIGLGLGAEQTLVTVTGFGVIVGIIALGHLIRQGPQAPNLYLTVASPAPGQLSVTQILELLRQSGARAALKRFDETPDLIEASFHVAFRDVAGLEQFNRKLRETCGGVKVSCLEERGLGV